MLRVGRKRGVKGRRPSSQGGGPPQKQKVVEVENRAAAALWCLPDTYQLHPPSTRPPRKETWSETSCRVNTRFISLRVCLLCQSLWNDQSRVGWLALTCGGIRNTCLHFRLAARPNAADEAEEKHGARACLYTAATACSSFIIRQTPHGAFQYIKSLFHTRRRTQYMSVYVCVWLTLHTHTGLCISVSCTHTQKQCRSVMTPSVTQWGADGVYRVKGHQLLCRHQPSVHHDGLVNFFTLHIKVTMKLHFDAVLLLKVEQLVAMWVFEGGGDQTRAQRRENIELTIIKNVCNVALCLLDV